MGSVQGLLRIIALAGSCLMMAGVADARSHHAAHRHSHARRYASASAHVIQCVAFAKADSDVELSGNAANWWENAAGIYARGSAPEVGSVLNFRANSRMRLGHVAVVSAVVDSRTIQIDQSHWNARGISRDVSVVDVSENNDWTAVRVELGHGGTYGSIYPTYGFIYARPDGTGRITVARADTMNRYDGGKLAGDGMVAQVAELSAASNTPAGRDVLSDDAPNRSVR